MSLDADTVLDLTDGENALTGAENSLVISGDTVDAAGGWEQTGSTEINGESYTVYQNESGAQTAVDDQVNFA